MGEIDNILPYTTEEHDKVINNTAKIIEIDKKVNDLTALKDSVVTMTALQKQLVEDSKKRDAQHDDMLKDNSKQWSSIASLTVKMDQTLVTQTNFMKSVDERLGDMKKDITDVKKDMGAISSATDIKKARISAIATAIAALVTAIAAIVVAAIK